MARRRPPLVPKPPRPSNLAVSAAMRGNRRINTKPELLVRRTLFRLGYRYRLHRNDLPGKPDIVFPSRRALIQVHGCFWHQHNGCSLGTMPRTNIPYWSAKLARNVARDRQSIEALEALGWRVLVVWECQAQEPNLAAQKVKKFLGPVG